ncbi:MAG: hypothetical protein P8M19_05575 [Crocinitomicaceae bacterium]|nr:hypothetical protein [Crocinitomicaceae bacterium]MDG1657377.1 hypothetical protein [Crocinitomicaceae bacterium]MDG2441121.1 hypothetical protein [Crocinitomicaceae bacterium]
MRQAELLELTTNSFVEDAFNDNMTKLDQLKDTNFEWTHEPKQSHKSIWNHLVLIVSQKAEHEWNWSVMDSEHDNFIIDSSGNHEVENESLMNAKEQAEACALAYQKEKQKNAEVVSLNITKRFFYVSAIALAVLLIKVLLIDRLIIGDSCYYHTHEAGKLVNFFYPSTAAEGFHPEPSTLNHILTFIIGSLIGWGVVSGINKYK